MNNEEVVENLQNIPFPFTIKDSEEYIKKSIKANSFEFAIIYEDILVGTIVLENPDSTKTIYEVGYFIARPYWRKGIATEALTQFLELDQTRPLFARAAQDNGGSIRVLEKCGFKIIGEDRGFANARGLEIEEYILRLDA